MSFRISLSRENRPARIRFFIGFLIGTISAGVPLYQKHEENKVRKDNEIFEVQMEELTKVQASINNLSEFIRQQKEQLKRAQQTVESLKNERDALRPVVEADREVVDTILRLQADRASANVWQERFIGFGLGILSSLVASLIWVGFKRG